MAGKSKSRRRLFGKFIYTLLLLAFGAFLTLTAYTWLERVYDYAEQYELSRPQKAVDAYLETLNRDKWNDGMERAVQMMPHETQSDEEIKAFVQERLTGGITAVRRSGANEAGTLSYSLRSSGREIGTMSIVEDQNYRGKVNLDQMPWPLVSRFLPGILEWGLKPWTVYSDSFDFSNLYNSFEITVPSTYSVFLNGRQLGSEYIVAEGIHYDVYEDYYYDLPMLPTKVTYRFDNVVGDVQAEIRDEDGSIVNIDSTKGDIQFIKPVDDETQQRLVNLMQPFTEKYLLFRSGATDGLTALNNLKPYIIPGSDIDKRAQDALDGLSWAHTSSFKLTDFQFNGVLPLANSCYVCSVTATTDTYTYGKGEVTDIIPLSVIVYDDGSTTLAFKVN